MYQTLEVPERGICVVEVCCPSLLISHFQKRGALHQDPFLTGHPLSVMARHVPSIPRALHPFSVPLMAFYPATSNCLMVCSRDPTDRLGSHRSISLTHLCPSELMKRGVNSLRGPLRVERKGHDLLRMGIEWVCLLWYLGFLVRYAGSRPGVVQNLPNATGFQCDDPASC